MQTTDLSIAFPAFSDTLFGLANRGQPVDLGETQIQRRDTTAFDNGCCFPIAIHGAGMATIEDDPDVGSLMSQACQPIIDLIIADEMLELSILADTEIRCQENFIKPIFLMELTGLVLQFGDLTAVPAQEDDDLAIGFGLINKLIEGLDDIASCGSLRFFFGPTDQSGDIGIGKLELCFERLPE